MLFDKELIQFNGLTGFDKIKYFYRLCLDWVYHLI